MSFKRMIGGKQWLAKSRASLYGVDSESILADWRQEELIKEIRKNNENNSVKEKAYNNQNVSSYIPNNYVSSFVSKPSGLPYVSLLDNKQKEVAGLSDATKIFFAFLWFLAGAYIAVNYFLSTIKGEWYKEIGSLVIGGGVLGIISFFVGFWIIDSAVVDRTVKALKK